MTKINKSALIDEARSLSFSRRYAEAVNVYRELASYFPCDSYVQHYLGYNLECERAQSWGFGLGGLPLKREAEHAYRKAVELSPSNPLWNSRLVVFLINHARHEAARNEWKQALHRVDPNGYRSQSESWVVNNLHYHVAEEWLNVGQIYDAIDVFGDIPNKVIMCVPRLIALKNDLEYAIDINELGYAIYSREIPFFKRWKKQLLRSLDESWDWFPGKVTDIFLGPLGKISIAYVDPCEPRPRALMITAISYDDWRSCIGDTAPKVGQYIELARKGDIIKLAVE